MLSFKQKIFLAYTIIYFLLIALMFPFSKHAVGRIVYMWMEERSQELIREIQATQNDESLFRLLREQKTLTFFRFSLITDEYKVIYDSHAQRVIGPQFSQQHVVHHPEVVDAFENGTGYSVGYSELLGQEFAYMGTSFDFRGKKYVLRTALPYKYVVQLTQDFEFGFFVVSSAVLLLFGFMTWLVINRLTAPINKVIKAVAPYQEGVVDTIPKIQTLSMDERDDFGKLAYTLNSLSEKIQQQIDSLRHERNEKEAVLESLVEGVVAVDRKMAITYANRTALQFLDLKGESVLGRIFDGTIQEVCQKLLLRCQQEQHILFETLMLKGETGKRYFNIVAVPQKDEKGAVLILQDQTAVYKMLEMKKDFVANASHELKTPITIIQGFAEMLHENPDLPVKTRGEMTEKIVRNCLRMTSLVKDLLTLSDVENIPESRLIDCDITAVIERCAAHLHDRFPEAKVVINQPKETSFLIKADPYLMEMAFSNLIENGIKYSNPPAEVVISLEETSPKTLQIKVSDKGIGIPPEDLEHIFERFYTVDKAHSQKMGGSGLGLSIVENTILKHGGTIRAESTVGVGTTFVIKFQLI